MVDANQSHSAHISMRLWWEKSLDSVFKCKSRLEIWFRNSRKWTKRILRRLELLRKNQRPKVCYKKLSRKSINSEEILNWSKMKRRHWILNSQLLMKSLPAPNLTELGRRLMLKLLNLPSKSLSSKLTKTSWMQLLPLMTLPSQAKLIKHSMPPSTNLLPRKPLRVNLIPKLKQMRRKLPNLRLPTLKLKTPWWWFHQDRNQHNNNSKLSKLPNKSTSIFSHKLMTKRVKEENWMMKSVTLRTKFKQELNSKHSEMPQMLLSKPVKTSKPVHTHQPNKP